MIFTQRCLDVGVSLNCITEFNFEDALATADTLDKLRESNPEILDQQPLFGVPVSIKDFFDLKGKLIQNHFFQIYYYYQQDYLLQLDALIRSRMYLLKMDLLSN